MTIGLELHVINKTNNNLFVYTVSDTNEMPGFYSFNINFKDLLDDEYEYKLYDPQKKLIGKGMILVESKDFEDYIEEYNPKIIYNVYNGAE